MTLYLMGANTSMWYISNDFLVETLSVRSEAQSIKANKTLLKRHQSRYPYSRKHAASDC